MSTVNTFWFENVEIRPHPWPGLNWVTTIVSVPDVKKARDLYINTFGFVNIFEADNPKNTEELVTVRLRYRGSNILVVKEGLDFEGTSPAATGSTPSCVFYIYVDDVKSVYANALKLGMTSVLEPNMTFWGDLRARLRCPFGYIWDIAQKVVE
ncbi:MAG: hypothetical protein LLF94_06710 [Chlamydiales bacterium]|nr:hypothetical protein [Chlamydiales bacterium]